MYQDKESEIDHNQVFYQVSVQIQTEPNLNEKIQKVQYDKGIQSESQQFQNIIQEESRNKQKQERLNEQINDDMEINQLQKQMEKCSKDNLLKQEIGKEKQDQQNQQDQENIIKGQQKQLENQDKLRQYIQKQIEYHLKDIEQKYQEKNNEMMITLSQLEYDMKSSLQNEILQVLKDQEYEKNELMISMKDKLKSFPKKIVIKEIEGYIERSLKKQMSSKVETKKMKIQDFQEEVQNIQKKFKRSMHILNKISLQLKKQ